MSAILCINHDKIIGECLETAFGLKTYIKIMECVSKEGFEATQEFRKLYNGYYRVRQKSQEWYDKYYELMEEQKSNERTMKDILSELSTIKPSVEVSFTSKLMATVNPDYPIWDQYVLQNLGLKDEWEKCRKKPIDERIKSADDIYCNKIMSLYSEFKASEKGKKAIAVIDKALPDYADKLTNTKKIDFILWSKRGR